MTKKKTVLKKDDRNAIPPAGIRTGSSLSSGFGGLFSMLLPTIAYAKN
ncbi:MAG: hypothetical protein HUJ54_05470 [Erysipelotrichaceae bacterium]|nr:hypothetical protein [Erysipelotrichaceae bacterium]